MKNTSKLSKIVLAGFLALTGCYDSSHDFKKEGEFRGYKATAFINPFGRGIHLKDDPKILLAAMDYDNDGVFDNILLEGLPKDHPLEKYANLDSLKLAYKELKTQ